MNFGQNLYNWFLSNAQSLVLMAIAVIGVYLGFKPDTGKCIRLQAWHCGRKSDQKTGSCRKAG